jgi:hypothetical protein
MRRVGRGGGRGCEGNYGIDGCTDVVINDGKVRFGLLAFLQYYGKLLTHQPRRHLHVRSFPILSRCKGCQDQELLKALRPLHRHGSMPHP